MAGGKRPNLAALLVIDVNKAAALNRCCNRHDVPPVSENTLRQDRDNFCHADQIIAHIPVAQPDSPRLISEIQEWVSLM